MPRRRRRIATRFSLFSFQDIITCVMGIMLLLTLLICLRITATSGRSSAAVRQQSQDLQTTVDTLQNKLAELQQQVRTNSRLLSSGGLTDINLLRNQQQQAEAAKASASQELRDILARNAAAAEALARFESTAQSQQQQQQQDLATLQQRTQRTRDLLRQISDGTRVVFNRYQGSANACWIIEVATDNSIQAALIGVAQPPQSFRNLNDTLNFIRTEHRKNAEFLLLIKPAANTAIDLLTGTLREEGISHAFDLLGPDQTAIDPQTGAAVL